jgi:hypothetical protein
MKILTKKVYYCDFCKKHSLSSYTIKEHEKHCTCNPNRECKMCEDGPLTFEIKTTSPSLTKYIEIDKNMCPACILSFARLNKIDIVKIKGTSETWYYKEAHDKWWIEKNAEKAEEDRYLF